jgi:cell division protein FtsB
MNRLISLKDRMRGMAWPLLVLLMLFYFAYHMVQGKHGIRAYFAYAQELKTLEVAAASTAQKRAQLENQMKLLDGQKLDPDMLDEMARRKLGYMTPDEAMIELPKSDAQ